MLPLSKEQVLALRERHAIYMADSGRFIFVVADGVGGAEAGEVASQTAIEVLDEDGDESPILPFNETEGGSDATTSLYVIRAGSETDGNYVQGLIGSKLIEHVAVGLLGTYYSDIVEANMGLGMFHPRAAVRIKGIL